MINWKTKPVVKELMVEWTDSDLKEAFENSDNYQTFEDLKEALIKRRLEPPSEEEIISNLT